jgi:glucokinase
MNVLAADVGGTSIRAALVSAEGRILERLQGPTPDDPEEGYSNLELYWHQLGQGLPRAMVVAGGIRPATGEITQSPNLLRWEGTRPGERLHCIVCNDANGACVGEAWLGGLSGRRSAVLLTLGTGVGGGILLDGKLWEGANGCAGEIGHMPVDPDGPPCPCGSRGCLELYASATAVAKAAGTRDAEEAARLAREGEPRSRGALEAAGEALGIVLAGVANLLNPEAICLGGGLSGAFDLLKPPLERTLRRRAFRLASESLDISRATLGNDAGILGAARLALDAHHHG